MTYFRKTASPWLRLRSGPSFFSAFVASLLVFAACGSAVAGPSSMRVDVRFTVNALPLCEITDLGGSDVIKVDFGSSLPMSSIDGVQHEKEIPYRIYCHRNILNGGYTQLKIRFTGDNANFGDRLLKTSQDNLAIEIRKSDGTVLPMGSSFVFDPQYSGGPAYISTPELKAVPVRRAGPGFPLDGGAFTANATMLVEFV